MVPLALLRLNHHNEKVICLSMRRANLWTSKNKFDELEKQYLNLSFLINKSNGGYHSVTATVSCLLYTSTSATLSATNWRWSPNDISLPSIWTKPLIMSTSCHHCGSLRTVPTTVVKQSTNPPPEAVGISFATAIIKRAKTFILVLRECITSYTGSTLLPNDRHDTLRDAFISLCINMRPLDIPLAVIRTDPTPCFMALNNDPVLDDHRIVLEIGRVKNLNKNTVVERAVQELELLQQDPHGGPVSPVVLSRHWRPSVLLLWPKQIPLKRSLPSYVHRWYLVPGKKVRRFTVVEHHLSY